MALVTAESALAEGPSTFRALQRRLSDALDHEPPADFGPGPTLEAQRAPIGEPPRLAKAPVLEGVDIRRHPIPGASEVGFFAFLDGVQASRVLLYDAAVPIVHGFVGAVIRRREDRRLSTWSLETESRIYAPLGLLSARANASLKAIHRSVVDTTPRRSDGEADDEARHPLTLADLAVSAVRWHREGLEQTLAETWVARERGMLYVDGGISGSPPIAAAPNVIGVVKSHRILYGDPAAVRTILSLTQGERSSVFLVDSPDRRRSPVASWYLRLRHAAGRGPLWGMVRVEVTAPAATGPHAIGARADEVSRWILAEVAPLSLPDSRWDTMVYGIRDCEQFLRSCQ
jgi:hypothetical protein